MADNSTQQGNDTIATDDIVDGGPADGAKVQRFKPGFGGNGEYKDVDRFEGLPVVLAENARDAYGRAKMVQPTTLFDSQTQYDKHPILWEDVLTGSASTTHIPNESSVQMTVTANAADKVIRQTREYFRYQPGKGQEIMLAGTFGAAVVGIDRRIGYFDDDNGIFLEQNELIALNIVLRSKVTGSVVNTKISQTNWNIDKFDGLGRSGITLDITKSQLLIIDLEWLSVGRIRIGFIIRGRICYFHEFLNANINPSGYMTTANLPLRYELNTNGTNGTTMKALSATVISNGGFSTARSWPFSASNGITPVSVSTRRPILSIRPKSAFNSITNRGLIIPTKWTGFTQTKETLFEVVWGGTLTAPSFVSVADDSIVEFDVAASAISGGIVLDSFYTEKKLTNLLDILNKFPMSLDKSGAHPTSPFTDIISIVPTSLSTATGCLGVLSWNELR